MNISDVAKKTGLTSKAIRFYEEKGLVTPPLRSENGYRTYSQQHLDELTLLRQARQVGCNLEECRELVALFNQGKLGLGELFQFLADDVVARHMLVEDRKYYALITA